MKKYRVYFVTEYCMDVEAESEGKAIELAKKRTDELDDANGWFIDAIKVVVGCCPSQERKIDG